jgi:triosephosphate isomerase
MKNKLMIAGNWKLNLDIDESKNLVSHLNPKSDVEIVIAPVFVNIFPLVSYAKEKSIALAAQNCSSHTSGAYTGEVSAPMLKKIGCEFIIVGHSERRSIFNEDNEMIARKAKAVYLNNMIPIICIGESKDQRENGVTNDILSQQIESVLGELTSIKDGIKRMVIAYEPVWAIGTGLTPNSDQIEEAHSHIKNVISQNDFNIDTKVLYGGSLKPENAEEILNIQNVDGGLIGGASLKSETFNKLIEIASTIG